jgi:DNA polymerase-3 subunit gamma/tau
MPQHQVLARKYRPQCFRDVLGQEAIVTTLKNAIKRKQLAHAYLFCGSRGTGKTTLARILAKAINCQHPQEGEPCNQCTSCKEITAGHSLDVLEIDGASLRGIDDIRQINETIGYAPASGKYKIYIIDEVHMLTKEAFNALLKTLEEPPFNVLFFFATTEPQKVLMTILSRCQRFSLNRIPLETIVNKLHQITQDLQVSIEREALRLIATRAEGGLRDAESLLDQILAFHEGEITAHSVAEILGIMPQEALFALDRAGKEGNLSMAFEIAHQLYSQGKELGHFLEGLMDHFRTILMIKIAGKNAPLLSLSEKESSQYAASAMLYTQEQCLYIIDLLVEAHTQRSNRSSRIGLEALLLKILRSHQRVPVDFLIRRLGEIEQRLNGEEAPVKHASPPAALQISLTEDPTPTKADLGIKEKKQQPSKPSIHSEIPPPAPPAPIELGARPSEEAQSDALKQQNRYDTLLQFATVELEGKIQRHKQ